MSTYTYSVHVNFECDEYNVLQSVWEFIHSFIFIFAFNKKYNNSIQKYIKDNIGTIFQLNYYKIKCGKGKKAYIEAGGL